MASDPTTSEWTISQLKQFFEAEIRQRDMRYDMQLQHSKEQIESAARALEVKLASMNEFRAALNDAALRNVTRAESENRINALSEKMDATIRPLEEKIETIRRPNWTLLSIMASVIVASIAGVWGIINLQITNAETPISLSVAQVKEQNAARDRTYADGIATNTVTINQLNERLRNVEDKVNTSALADEQSRTDRSQLNGRVHDLEAGFASGTADRRAAIAAINSSLTEIETQFAAADQIRNLMHANDLRIESMLWRKVFPGSEFPTNNAYYPSISHGGQSK